MNLLLLELIWCERNGGGLSGNGCGDFFYQLATVLILTAMRRFLHRFVKLQLRANPKADRIQAISVRSAA